MNFKNPPSDHPARGGSETMRGKACILRGLRIFQTGRKNKFFKQIRSKNKNLPLQTGGTPYAHKELRVI